MRRADAETRFRTRWLAIAAAALGLSGLLATQAVQARSEQWVAFDVVATADAARVTTFVPGGPLNDRVFDIGAPKAQARVDGLGTSAGYAAGLHPDDLVLNVPGIAAGATRQDVPPYPLLASSSHPAKPSGSLDAGVAVLRSTSEAGRSIASATIGATGTAVTGATATADAARRADATLAATATSTVEGITVGPLTIARLSSAATTTRTPQGGLSRASSAVVTGAAVGGTAVAIDRKGLAAAEPARAALAAAGLTLRWLDEVNVPTGVTSPGLEITLAVPASLTGSGSSTLTYTFGRSTALASGVPAPAAGPAPAPITPAVPTGTEAGCCDTPAPSSSSSPFSPGSPSALPAPAAPAADPGQGAAGQQPVALDASPVVRVVPETWPVGWYVVLIGSAGLIALAAFALHMLGVRSTWRS